MFMSRRRWRAVVLQGLLLGGALWLAYHALPHGRRPQFIILVGWAALATALLYGAFSLIGSLLGSWVAKQHSTDPSATEEGNIREMNRDEAARLAHVWLAKTTWQIESRAPSLADVRDRLLSIARWDRRVLDDYARWFAAYSRITAHELELDISLDEPALAGDASSEVVRVGYVGGEPLWCSTCHGDVFVAAESDGRGATERWPSLCHYVLWTAMCDVDGQADDHVLSRKAES